MTLFQNGLIQRLYEVLRKEWSMETGRTSGSSERGTSYGDKAREVRVLSSVWLSGEIMIKLSCLTYAPMEGKGEPIYEHKGLEVAYEKMQSSVMASAVGFVL